MKCVVHGKLRNGGTHLNAENVASVVPIIRSLSPHSTSVKLRVVRVGTVRTAGGLGRGQYDSRPVLHILWYGFSKEDEVGFMLYLGGKEWS